MEPNRRFVVVQNRRNQNVKVKKSALSSTPNKKNKKKFAYVQMMDAKKLKNFVKPS